MTKKEFPKLTAVPDWEPPKPKPPPPKPKPPPLPLRIEITPGWEKLIETETGRVIWSGKPKPQLMKDAKKRLDKLMAAYDGREDL